MSEDPVNVPAARHETSDIGERLIWITTGAVVGMLMLCGFVVLRLFPQSNLDHTLPLLPIYPAPRLQADPAADMRSFSMAQQRRLEGSGWVDKAHGVAHIPIDEAMRLVAQEGIADWPASGKSP